MQTKEQRIEQLLKKHPENDREAYNFVNDALTKTLENLKRRENAHVTPQELLEGVKEYAIKKFGYLAQTIFNIWGVHSTSDIGNLVFQLIEFDLLGKQKTDRREDFDNVYDFNTAFSLQPVFFYCPINKIWTTFYVQRN